MIRQTIATFLTLFCYSILPAQVVTEYRATLDNMGVIREGNAGTMSTATGVATFELTQYPDDPAATTLRYHIQLYGVDLGSEQTPSMTDDVTGVHLHDTTRCVTGTNCISGDTASTVHVLNIYGLPRRDDDDLVLDEPNSILDGLWDESDINLDPPAPTVAISDPRTLALLANGEMALMVHTVEEPGAAIGGFLLPVPEPGGLLLAAMALLPLLGRRR